MSARAEQAALRAYPPSYSKWNRNAKRIQSFKVDTHRPLRRIYIKGYEQAEKDLGWHSVKESLPPMDEEVIVLTDNIHGKTVPDAQYICYGHIVNKDTAVDYDGWNIPGVTHWMYLPKI